MKFVTYNIQFGRGRDARFDCGPLSAYGGRIGNPEGFVDAWVASGHGEGVSAETRGRPVRIGYCFVSTALASRIGGVRIDADAQGSDHQPVWMDLAL